MLGLRLTNPASLTPAKRLNLSFRALSLVISSAARNLLLPYAGESLPSAKSKGQPRHADSRAGFPINNQKSTIPGKPRPPSRLEMRQTRPAAQYASSLRGADSAVRFVSGHRFSGAAPAPKPMCISRRVRSAADICSSRWVLCGTPEGVP
jgi:hypothetical protein